MLLLFFKEHPNHSALCLDISVELSPFAVKSMFWLRSGPITLQEITYPDLVVAWTGHLVTVICPLSFLTTPSQFENELKLSIFSNSNN